MYVLVEGVGGQSDDGDLPGVRAVITYEDAPDMRFNGNGEDWDILESERVLDSRVRYVGDKVAAVAADTDAIAAAALKLIKVEYEDLPAYFDAEEAVAWGLADRVITEL